MKQQRHKFGTDMNPSGMLNAFGRRPGFQERYQTPCVKDGRVISVTFTTTREALAQVVPPPLKLVDSLPPIVAAVLFDNENYLAWDGKNHPYTEVGIWFPCQYKDVIGMHAFHLYLDGPGAFTGCLGGREALGVCKQPATINHVYDMDEIWVTAISEGIPRISFYAHCPKEVGAGENPFSLTKYLFLKEIPNCSFTGYDVRKVIMQEWDFVGKPKLMKVGEGEVKLGPPFDVLDIVEQGPAYYCIQDSPASTMFEGMIELDDLLKK